MSKINCGDKIIDVSTLNPCCVEALQCLGLLCIDDGQYCGFEKRADGTIHWVRCADLTSCGALGQTQCPHTEDECNGCQLGLYNHNGICVEECPPGTIPDQCNNCVNITTECGGVNQIPCATGCNEGLYSHNGLCVSICPTGYAPNSNGVCVANNAAPQVPSSYRGKTASYPISSTPGNVWNDTITFLIVNPFVDPEGQPVTYTVTNLPAGLVRDQGNQKITGNIGISGTYQASIKACDSLGNCSAIYPLYIQVL